MWKLKNIHWLAIILIYATFFGMIIFAIYTTQSATPLWALILTPSYSYNDKKSNKKGIKTNL